MAENSKIEWTDHTFNPWIGCTKVSDGCKHCYAETLMDKRYGRVGWCPQGTRQRTSEANWRKPLAWNRRAKAEGRRYKVFCASLADVFEDRQELIAWRVDLLDMIGRTSHLDWLLLTKRPENVQDMIAQATGRHPEAWLANHMNVWIGTSVEDQKAADERIPHLLHIPARVRFLSMEPLLGAVGLDQVYDHTLRTPGTILMPFYHGIHWVIVGGESGPHARPMHPDWVRSIRDQCVDASVPFFFKQWGEWLPGEQTRDSGTAYGRCDNGQIFGVAGQPARHDFGATPYNGPTIALRVGKANAGRILDGQEWSQFPQMQVTP